jgi:hypothetical protein
MSGAEGTSGYRAFTFEVSFRPSLDGQITESCPAPFAKIFRFALTPNQHYIPRRPVPQRGARAIVTDAGRDAVDTDGAEDDRRWRWTAKSCGPDAPTLESSFAGISARRRWQKSPVTGRARRKPLKPLRAGMPGDLGEPVVTTLVCFFHLHARLRVHWAPGIPHALCFQGEASMHTSGAIVPRERGGASFRHCERSEATKQSSSLRFGEAGLLRWRSQLMVSGSRRQNGLLRNLEPCSP